MGATRKAFWGTILLAGACGGEQASSDVGIEEPIQVTSGQFVQGRIPGSPAPDAGVDAAATPGVVDVNVGDTAIAQGELGLVFTGHTTVDAQTAAVRFADLGSGYWVVPVGAPDPSDNGLLTWQITANFGRGLPPGFHDLVFAAVDANGASGTQAALSVCIDTPVPDNLNICVPKRRPPAAVLSLSWDSPMDLDLILQGPTGQVIGGKVASSQPADAGTAAAANGTLDRDSNRACVIDNIDREDVVWQSTPTTGTWQVWVDPFSACGATATRFSVSLWVAEDQADGTQRLIEQDPPVATGLLEAVQATGGASRGLYVGEFVLR